MTRAEAIRRKACEDAELARIKRELAEIELEVKRGRFRDAEELAGEVERFVATLVQQLDGVPAKFAARYPSTTPDMVDGLRLIIDGVRREVAG